MKKISSFLITCLLAFVATAQPCTPDPTITKAGLYPNKLPDGIVGTPYEMVVTLMVPLDTMIKYQGNNYNVRVDSASVVAISDLPTGFGYTCDKTSRTWNGGQRGCAKLYGNPVAADVGSYVIYVKVRTFFKIIGLPNQLDQLDSSSIDFRVVMPNALEELNQLNGVKIFPNPAKEKLTVSMNQYRSDASFRITDILGNEIAGTPEFNGNTGEVSFDVSNFKSGVYFIRTTIDGLSNVQKFMKE